MVPNFRAVVLTAAFSCASAGAAQAICRGHDLFPQLEARAPAAYAAMEAEKRAIPFGQGKLFRLSRAGQEPSYIFGSLHLADPRITEFSPQLHAALAGSKVVALETTDTGASLDRTTERDRFELRKALVAEGDRRPDRLLDTADLADFDRVFERRSIWIISARDLKVSVLSLLDQPQCAAGHPYAEELIAEIARQRQTPLAGLETVTEQLTILDGLTRATERDLLVAILRQADYSEDMVETTIVRHQTSDLGGLLAWMRSPEPIPGVAGAQTPPAFLERLLTMRNHRMRERTLPLLKKGGAFIAVGAAHLPGQEGLLQLLEQDGYRVEFIE
jgi:uncharacterized protein YbaP (TraB family)